MNEISRDEFGRLCDQVLVPKFDTVFLERLRSLREMIEMVARGLADLHDRLDERDRPSV